MQLLIFLKALSKAAQVFPKVSFDMIYARRAQQTTEKWQTELSNALKLCQGPINHVSLYTLVMEVSAVRIRT